MSRYLLRFNENGLVRASHQAAFIRWTQEEP